MEFLQNASDDQIALMGCVVALMFSMAVMFLSGFVGRSNANSRHVDLRSAQRVPVRQPVAVSQNERVSADPRDRAA